MLRRIRLSAYAHAIVIVMALAAGLVGVALPDISYASGIAYFAGLVFACGAVWMLWKPKTVYRAVR